MKKSTELKKLALLRLTGCWGESCAIVFIMFGELAAAVLIIEIFWDSLVTRAPDGFTSGAAIVLFAVAAALLWFAVAPFSYGIKWYRIQQIRGVTVQARSMFSCYASFKKLIQVLKLNSMTALRSMPMFISIVAMAAAAFYLPDKICGALGGGTVLYSVIRVLFLLLAAAAVLGLQAARMKYALAPYLYVLEPGADPAKLIKKSKVLMKNHYRYLLKTGASLAGWTIPCLLIFPVIFVIPYIEMVYTAAINEILEYSKETTAQNGQYTGTLNEIRTN